MTMMNVVEVAQVLGVTVDRLRAWVAAGVGPDSVTVDGAPFFDMDDVRHWVRTLPVVEGLPVIPAIGAGRQVLH